MRIVGLFAIIYLSSAVTGLILPNANKIGLGFDPIIGTNTCFTGMCQMEGSQVAVFLFQRQVLNSFSCATGIYEIPKSINFQYLGGGYQTFNTQTLSSSNSIRSLVQKQIIYTNPDIQSYLYSQSWEIKTLIKNLYLDNKRLFISKFVNEYYNLTLQNAPITLNFNNSVKALPIVKNDIAYNAFISQYGFTYIYEITLGGIQHRFTSFTEKDAYQLEVNQGINLEKYADVDYCSYIGQKYDKPFEPQKLTQFREKATYFTSSLGGSVDIRKDLSQWNDSVQSNPVTTQIVLKNISDLLTSYYFPTDQNISIQQNLLEEAVRDYAQRSPFTQCVNNCNKRGTCQPGPNFNMGECYCNSPYEGLGCERTSQTLINN